LFAAFLLSPAVGVGTSFGIFPAATSAGCGFLLEFRTCSERTDIEAVGVESQHKDSISIVRRTNGGSRYAMPFSIKPDLGQRPENSVQPSSKQPCHVLQDNCSRLQFSNQANGLKEEPASGSIKSCPFPGVGNVLTGKSADDAIDPLKIVPSALPDVSLAMHVWPVPLKDFGRIVIDFHLPLAL
jgi:hypothetical protein